MKFSIIIPIYNSEKFIKNTIDSVLGQKSGNFELILIDDGSTDNSGNIIDLYEKYDYVKIFHKTNSGLGGTRNFGLSKAKGEYIWFIDSDDYITNDALQILSDEIKSGEDIICFDYYDDINGKLIDNTSKIIDSNNMFTYNPSVCFKLLKREFIEKNNLKFSEVLYEDLEFSTILNYYNPSVKYISKKLYYYVYNISSIIHSKKYNEKKDDIYTVFTNIDKLYKDNKKAEIEFVYIYHLMYSYSLSLLNYEKKVYKPRINKNINIIKSKYKNWQNNFYYKKMDFKEKLIINLIYFKMYTFLKFMMFIHVKLKERSNKQ